MTARSTVIDIGCGTGILGFFAVQAGCRQVYAIEQSDFIHHAAETARNNGFSDRIEFIQSDVCNVRLPRRADVIVHDQIGDFVWDEGMVEKMVYARRQLLKKGGKILPANFDVYLVPVRFPAPPVDRAFWRRRHYGIDFGNFEAVERAQARMIREPAVITVLGRSSYLSTPELVASTDLYRDRHPPKMMNAEFVVRRRRQSVCAGILGFFDVRFDATISFSTRPSHRCTNWGQFFLPNETPLTCHPGDRIQVKVKMSAVDRRSWSWRIRSI